MESATVTKTFHGNPTPPKSPALRDASFSSYLRPDESINCQRHLTIGHGGCRALDDSELSIFDAHKYFNEATDNDMQKVTISSNSRVSPLVNLNVEQNLERGDIAAEVRRYSSASSSVDGYANIRNYRARSFHTATPTACSEASWNSQTGLLSHPPGAIPVSMRNPPHPTDPNRKFRDSLYKPISLFRRKCPCSGKKSVEVKENTLDHKTHQMPQTPPPPPPPRLSHSQITRDSMDLKRQQDLDSPKSKTPIDKFTKNMETTVANKPETQKIPITHSNNWVVDQRHRDQEVFVAKSQRFQPTETQVPAILQPQRLLASVRPFTDGFTFPVLNPHSAVSTIKLQDLNAVDEVPSRESLEVFRTPDIEPDSVSRKPIGRDPQNFPFPPSPKSRIIDDDVASDASSDLFEIESFSTQTTSTYPIIYRRRDSLDEANSFDARRLGTNNNNAFLFGRQSTDSTTPTITECYEPSEASIDWSVTTAEGFDRASVANFSVSASQVADDASVVQSHGGSGEHAPEKGKRKGSSVNGLLLSCRCEKAVSVGPQPVKSVEVGEGQKGATSCIASSRHVSSRVGTVNKAPQGRPHTARMSLPFGT